MNSDSNTYKTITGTTETEIVEKKSRFISHLSHVESEEEAREFLNRIREENIQARHNVYAYLLRNGRARYSDDGEPAQTSGLPTFETLQHAKLADVICVTTRYFGGILLGTGGLVRAYTSSCATAIAAAHIIEICSCQDLSFNVNYEMNSSVQKIISEDKISVIQCDYSDHVSYTLRCRVQQCADLKAKLIEATRGQVEIKVSKPHDAAI